MGDMLPAPINPDDEKLAGLLGEPETTGKRGASRK
jgi:hypothetical protein